jgi:hypothetical protein
MVETNFKNESAFTLIKLQVIFANIALLAHWDKNGVPANGNEVFSDGSACRVKAADRRYVDGGWNPAAIELFFYHNNLDGGFGSQGQPVADN